MRLAILSDTRMPTSPTMPAHGLGQIAHAVASGLLAKGHEVTLFAAPGSSFDGALVTEKDERDFLRHNLLGFSAIMDNSHKKVSSQIKGLPAIQVSHDREFRPTANAVFPSQKHALYHKFNRTNARIVHNGVEVQNIEPNDTGYYAYLSTFFPAKGAHSALQAAHLAGVKLIMAGPTPVAPPPGSNYIGPLIGRDKLKFLAGAKALLFPSAIEAAPVTILEAQSVGCPVIVSKFGGSSENMQDGLTGFIVSDTEDMAAKIPLADSIDRKACQQWIHENRSLQQMVDGYEKLLQAVAAGERW